VTVVDVATLAAIVFAVLVMLALREHYRWPR
jgi:hypothetical protein